MLNKEIFIKRTPPPLHWMHKDCLIYPDFTTTVCHKTYSTSLLHSLTVCPLSVSLFSAPQTPGCVGQIHGRHQKLYLQNVPWLKRFSSWLAPLFSPLYPRFVFCLPPPYWSRYICPSGCHFCFQFISSDVLGFSSPIITFSLPVCTLSICKFGLQIKWTNLHQKSFCFMLLFYLLCYMEDVLSFPHTKDRIYWFCEC